MGTLPNFKFSIIIKKKRREKNKIPLACLPCTETNPGLFTKLFDQSCGNLEPYHFEAKSQSEIFKNDNFYVTDNLLQTLS